jgi:hypothetical protein
MTRRQSHNQWSGSKVAHLVSKNSECKNLLEEFLPRFFDYLPKDQTVNAEYYSSLLVQLKDILKYSAPVERGLTGGQKY